MFIRWLMKDGSEMAVPGCNVQRDPSATLGMTRREKGYARNEAVLGVHCRVGEG